MKGKTALVTGASGEIGSAAAAALFEAGYHVVIHYFRNRQSAEALAVELNRRETEQRALAVQADITRSEEVERLFERLEEQLPPVDLLVNNAGIAQQKLFTDLTDEDWSSMIATNLTGAFYCSRRAVSGMIRKHSGRIINISSMWGQVGASCEVSYSAAKAGLIGMTRALAKEVGPSGITVNCICPGVIDTKMNAHLTQDDLQELVEETPMCRLGTPEDVARCICFLASEAGDYITGQVLGVNGGMVI